MPKLKHNTREQGFTLVEVVLSMGIIAVTLTLFALMLTNLANIQGDLDRQRIAERILYGEAEKISAMRWDNIMPNPSSGRFANCALNNVLTSTQAVNSGPETFTVDSVEVSITRNVQWHLSETAVECTDENKFRAEPKRITINATWNGKSETKTKSLVIIRSRWAEAPLESELRGNTGRATSVVYEEGFTSAANWCGSYSDPDTNTLLTPGSASLLNNGLNLNFGANQEGVCGIVLTSLEVGKSYTLVATVTVPDNSTETTIAVQGNGEGALALPGVGATVLTHSWVETSTSRRVGFAIPAASENENGDTAFISSFVIYKNN